MSFFMRFFIILTLMLGSALFGSVGKVSLLKGNAYAQRESQKVVLTSGSVLEEKDTITTAKDAQMQIIFEDKTVITLGSESELKIEEYFNDATKPKAKFKFGEGSFKSITGQIGKTAPENFTLETKTATIGIRGTTIRGHVRKDGDTIACLSGTITVAAIGSPNIVIVPAGKSTFVAHGTLPTTPQNIAPQNGEAPLDNNNNPPLSNETTATSTVVETITNVASDVTNRATTDLITSTVAEQRPSLPNYGSGYFFSDTHTIESSGTASVGYSTVTLTQRTNLTIATYGPTTDPVIQVLKSNNEYVTQNDDSWTSAFSANNAIVTLSLEPGVYKIAVSDYPFSTDEAISGTNTNNYVGPITLHFSADNPVAITGNQITTYANIPNAYGSKVSYTGITSLNPSIMLNTLIDSPIGTTVRGANNDLYVSIPDSPIYVAYSDAYQSFDWFGFTSDSESNTDIGISWGYWISGSENTYDINNQQNTWVAGIKTPTDFLNSLNTNNITYSYAGKVIGSVNENGSTGLILYDSSNAINLNINFGSSSITGNIAFKTSNGTTWNSTLTTSSLSRETSSFAADAIRGVTGNSTGSLNGNFYGTQANFAAGSFNLTKGGNINAIGSFKASKQPLQAQ